MIIAPYFTAKSQAPDQAGTDEWDAQDMSEQTIFGRAGQHNPASEGLAAKSDGRSWPTTAIATGTLQRKQPVTRELITMVGKIAFIVFTIEVLITLTVFSGGELNGKIVQDGLLDGTILTLFASPFIYWWVARPFAEAARTARAELVEQLSETRRLLDQNEKLRASLQKMSENAAEINERILQKIGADLHDGAAQLLSFSLLKLDRLAPGLKIAGDKKGLVELEKMRGVLTDTLREVRGISTGLSLPELDTVTVEETIQLVIRRHEEFTGSKIALSMWALPHQVPISQKAAIYRFIQEALSNAFKHGKATSTRVSARGGNGLEISVTDDGQGFDPDAVTPGGLGLTGMRARIQAIGGRLDIKSAPGQGTKATAVFNSKP